MKIKKGDKVKIVTGKDKGKTGKVLQVFTSRNRVSVEGLNISIKHMRPRKQGEKGQRIEFPAPMAASNLMLICPKCNKPTRIGYDYTKTSKPSTTAAKTVTEDKTKISLKKKKHRVCKKCKQTID